MCEEKNERKEAFKTLEENIDKHLGIVDDMITIFSKIKADSSVIEDFKVLLNRTNCLKDLRGTLLRVNKRELDDVVNRLKRLRNALTRIEINKK